MLRHCRTTCLFVTLLSTAVQAQHRFYDSVQLHLKRGVETEAAWAMEQLPVTITAYPAPRSSGGLHDFFSEADYWWPDPANPGGPYVQRDGQTNPDNFVAHRHAMIRFSRIMGALASAYLVEGEEKYAKHAMVHAKAWFVESETRMNPSLLYAQAIKGRATGRGIGIIDTIHLIEVAQALLVFARVGAIDAAVLTELKAWFTEYLDWLTTHQYGKDEMNALNNHGTCWVMQVASFSQLTDNRDLLQQCRDRYKNVLLPGQMAPDGSFPREMARTKPYGYSLFNLDAMVMICQVLSTTDDNLWEFELADGRSIRKGIEFLHPFVADKRKWPHPPDVMYWNEWPVAHPFLVFGATAFGRSQWFDTWTKLEHYPKGEEVIRNLPVRNPVIWMIDAK